MTSPLRIDTRRRTSRKPSTIVDTTALVDYEAQWYRLGGGPDLDIWDRFGLLPRDYFDQVLTSLDEHRDRLPAATVSGIRSVARRRLWLAS